MEREKKNRPKIVAVLVAVVLIVALIVGMVSCSSGNTTDPTDGTGEQLEHYPVGVVTKPTGEGSEPVKGGETSGATETTEPPVGTVPGETAPIETTEPAETTVPTEGKPSGEKPTDPVKPTEPKPTSPKPTEPKPTQPKPTEPKPTVPTPTEPKPTEPKPTEPKPTEPPVKPTEPHKHSYTSTVTTSATCTKTGVRTYKCSCGASYTETIPSAGHTVQYKTVAATCTEGGYRVDICSVCGVEVSRTNTSPALGHNEGVTDRKDKSCEEDGYVTYTCSRCGESHTNVMPATGHSWIHHHEDAEGYTEYGLQCHCGYVCWESEAEAAGMDIYMYYHFVHVKSFESSKGHSCYDTSRWIETKPAVDYDECSVCGKRK